MVNVNELKSANPKVMALQRRRKDMKTKWYRIDKFVWAGMKWAGRQIAKPFVWLWDTKPIIVARNFVDARPRIKMTFGLLASAAAMTVTYIIFALAFILVLISPIWLMPFAMIAYVVALIAFNLAIFAALIFLVGIIYPPAANELFNILF